MSSIVERSAAYERAQARVQKAAARYDAANTGEEIAAAGEQLDLAVSDRLAILGGVRRCGGV